MERIRACRPGLLCLLLPCLLILTPPLLAESSAEPAPVLVEDLFSGELNVTSEGGSLGDFRVLGERLFFAADEAQHGSELWVWEATKEPELFVDICQGPCSSRLRHPVVAGDSLFFFADDRLAGQELWVTDGTRGGTRMVRDSCPGSCGFNVQQALPLGERVLFISWTGLSSRALWSSDGTAAGTFLLREFSVDNAADTEPQMARLGDEVLFGDAEGGIWSSDGTPSGTRRIQSLFGEGGPRGWAVSGDVAYFTRQGVLWGTRGEGDATPLVSLISALGGSAINRVRAAKEFVELSGESFFLASADGRCSLWKTDGTRAGTRIVTEMRSTTTTIRCPRFMVEARGLLFFEMITDDVGEEMWISNGTSNGTRRLADLVPGFRGLNVGSLVSFGGHAYFNSNLGLWRSNGTVGGTGLLLERGTLGLEVVESPFGLAEDRLFFMSEGEENHLRELWSVERGELPEIVAERSAALSSSSPSHLRSLDGGGLLFTAQTTDGRQLFATGVEPGEAEQLSSGRQVDLTVGYTDFGDGQAVLSNDLLFTDGTAAGTFRISRTGGRSLARVGDRLFYSSGELWTSDGTDLGTFEVKDIFPGVNCCVSPPGTPLSSSPGYFLDLDGDALFSATDERGRELWRSDGTEAGTEIVADIQPGSRGSAPQSPRRLDTGEVLFTAWTDELGRELWRTDGTEAGTRLFLELEPGPESSDPKGLVFLGDQLFFVASQDGGLRLFRSDQSAAGTAPTVDLAAAGVLDVGKIVESAGRLYFTAFTSSTGWELWTSDGTAAGTRLVTDIAPGAWSSNPRDLETVGDRLYFVASDGVHGAELWHTDGTTSALVADLAPGASSSAPSSLALDGDRLYFAATRADIGQELWSLGVDVSEGLCTPSATVHCLDGRFQLEAFYQLENGAEQAALASGRTADSAFFTFFDAENVELAVKVIDGQTFNDHHWLFYAALSDVQYRLVATDFLTGVERVFVNPQGTFCGDADIEAFPAADSGAAIPAATDAASPRWKENSCLGEVGSLCLLDRFEVSVRWRFERDGVVQEGTGTPLELGEQSGSFSFFDADNVELVLKVLDGRGFNGRFWFFYGALSDVEYEITVDDRETGEQKIYRNEAGNLCGAADIEAF